VDLGLQGRTVLITGATRGLGRAIAMSVAAEGANVVICGRGVDALAEARDALVAAGANVHAVTADVTEAGVVDRLVAETLDAFGQLDGVVANAGGAVGQPRLADTTDEDWEATYRWTVVYAAAVIRAARAALAESDAASVVLVGSVSAGLPSPWPQYAAAKAALEAMTRSLAAELGPDGIRVNCVRPGSMLFEGGAWQRYADAEPDAFAAFAATDFPAGRLGDPREVADVATFLLSSRARWINGAIVAVDGGQRRSSPYPKTDVHDAG
jgi:3-oxoacyl-[acyl-carrier protein] reductase